MNKFTFLKLLILILFISNLVLLYFLFNDWSNKKGPKSIIIERLHFDSEQIKSYEMYIEKHRGAINSNEMKIKKLRSRLFEQLKYKQDSLTVDSIVSGILKQQYLAERINYNHFLEIKALCKPSQINDYNDLTKDIADLFLTKGSK